MRCLPILCFCPFLAGCFAIGFPDVNRTPEVAIADDQVQAFRVATQYECGGVAGLKGHWSHTTVQEVSIAAGKLESQQDVQFTYYWILFPVIAHGASHDFQVVLYRPGYELVEIPASPWWWPLGYCQVKSLRWCWKVTADLSTQIKTLEKLLLKAGERGSHDLSQEMCWFAAREYNRLAQSSSAAVPEMRQERERLLVKARLYEDLARPLPNTEVISPSTKKEER